MDEMTVPDQLQIDLRDNHADRRSVAGNRQGHVGLGAAVQRYRAVPAACGSRACDGRVCRAVDAATNNIRLNPGDLQPLDPGAIYQGDLGEGWHLAEELQRTDSVVLEVGICPG